MTLVLADARMTGDSIEELLSRRRLARNVADENKMAQDREALGRLTHGCGVLERRFLRLVGRWRDRPQPNTVHRFASVYGRRGK
jgi:hypothetical protein